VSLEKIVANLVQKVERRFYGKYKGFVVDNADPEQLGRLKLRVPSLLGDEVVIGWAMPCVPYGGDANQGFLFIPEVDAGVWVEFEEGDLEFPIWVGTFWSKPGGESELPKPNDPDGTEQGSVQDPPTRKIIKTVKGHTIQFEDAAGEEMVTIVEATNGHVITMNQEGIKITDGANDHVITLTREGIQAQDGANSHEVTFSAQGITVKDGVNQHQVTLESTGVSIQTATGAKVELTAAQTTVDAGAGIVAVKGSLVQLGPGALPVIRMGDQGIGNLGAPVPITITTNTQVLA